MPLFSYYFTKHTMNFTIFAINREKIKYHFFAKNIKSNNKKYYIFCVLILLTVIIVNELKPNNDRVGTIISKCIGVQTLV